MKKAWKSLDVNDWIVCPRDDIPERVTSSRRYANGRHFVRTTRHDHMRPVSEVVEVVDAPEWAR